MKSFIFFLTLMMPILSFGEQKIFFKGLQDIHDEKNKDYNFEYYTKVLYDSKNESIKVFTYFISDKKKKEQSHLVKTDYKKDPKGQWWVVVWSDKVATKEKAEILFKNKKLQSISYIVKNRKRPDGTFTFKYNVKFEESKVGGELHIIRTNGKVAMQAVSSGAYFDELEFNKKISKLKVSKINQF